MCIHKQQITEHTEPGGYAENPDPQINKQINIENVNCHFKNDCQYFHSYLKCFCFEVHTLHLNDETAK